MGIESLCKAVAGAVRRDDKRDNIIRGKISGNAVEVAGRSYGYKLAVDIQVADGEWVYVAIVNNQAVVLGK